MGAGIFGEGLSWGGYWEDDWSGSQHYAHIFLSEACFLFLYQRLGFIPGLFKGHQECVSLCPFKAIKLPKPGWHASLLLPFYAETSSTPYNTVWWVYIFSMIARRHKYLMVIVIGWSLLRFTFATVTQIKGWGDGITSRTWALDEGVSAFEILDPHEKPSTGVLQSSLGFELRSRWVGAIGWGRWSIADISNRSQVIVRAQILSVSILLLHFWGPRLLCICSTCQCNPPLNQHVSCQASQVRNEDWLCMFRGKMGGIFF